MGTPRQILEQLAALNGENKERVVEARRTLRTFAIDQPEDFGEDACELLAAHLDPGWHTPPELLTVVEHVGRHRSWLLAKALPVALRDLEEGLGTEREACSVVVAAIDIGLQLDVTPFVPALARRLQVPGNSFLLPTREAVLASSVARTLSRLVELRSEDVLAAIADMFDQEDDEWHVAAALAVEVLASTGTLASTDAERLAVWCSAFLAAARPTAEKPQRESWIATRRALGALFPLAPAEVLQLLLVVARQQIWDRAIVIDTLRFADCPEDDDGEWLRLAIDVVANTNEPLELRFHLADALHYNSEVTGGLLTPHLERLLDRFEAAWAEFKRAADASGPTQELRGAITSRLMDMLIWAGRADVPTFFRLIDPRLDSYPARETWNELLVAAARVAASDLLEFDRLLPRVADLIRESQDLRRWEAALRCCDAFVQSVPSALPGDVIERIAEVLARRDHPVLVAEVGRLFGTALVPEATAVVVVDAVAGALERSAGRHRTDHGVEPLVRALLELASRHQTCRPRVVAALCRAYQSLNALNATDAINASAHVGLWYPQFAPTVARALVGSATLHGFPCRDNVYPYSRWFDYLLNMPPSAIHEVASELIGLARERSMPDKLLVASALQAAGLYDEASSLLHLAAERESPTPMMADDAHWSTAYAHCLSIETTIAAGERVSWSAVSIALESAASIGRLKRGMWDRWDELDQARREVAVRERLRRYLPQIEQWVRFREEWGNIALLSDLGPLSQSLQEMAAWCSDGGDEQAQQVTEALLSAATAALRWESELLAASPSADTHASVVTAELARVFAGGDEDKWLPPSFHALYRALPQTWSQCMSDGSSRALLLRIAELPLPVPRFGDAAYARWTLGRKGRRGGGGRVRSKPEPEEREWALHFDVAWQGRPAGSVNFAEPNVAYEVKVSVRTPKGLRGTLRLAAVTSARSDLADFHFPSVVLTGYKPSVELEGSFVARYRQASGSEPLRIRLVPILDEPPDARLLVSGDEELLVSVGVEPPETERAAWASQRGIEPPSDAELKEGGYWGRTSLFISAGHSGKAPVTVFVNDTPVKLGSVTAWRVLVLIRFAFENERGWIKLEAGPYDGLLHNPAFLDKEWDPLFGHLCEVFSAYLGGREGRRLFMRKAGRVRTTVHPYYINWDAEEIFRHGSPEVQSELKVLIEAREQWAELRGRSGAPE